MKELRQWVFLVRILGNKAPSVTVKMPEQQGQQWYPPFPPALPLQGEPPKVAGGQEQQGWPMGGFPNWWDVTADQEEEGLEYE
jgi:hypothetical protein